MALGGRPSSNTPSSARGNAREVRAAGGQAVAARRHARVQTAAAGRRVVEQRALGCSGPQRAKGRTLDDLQDVHRLGQLRHERGQVAALRERSSWGAQAAAGVERRQAGGRQAAASCPRLTPRPAAPRHAGRTHHVLHEPPVVPRVCQQQEAQRQQRAEQVSAAHGWRAATAELVATAVCEHAGGRRAPKGPAGRRRPLAPLRRVHAGRLVAESCFCASA